MKISLDQALDIRSAASKRIHELINERKSVAFVTVGKDEKYESPERSIEVIEEELAQARQDYLDIDQLINTYNCKQVIDWDGKKISIFTAIELAKQLQGETNIVKDFGKRKKQETSQDWRSQAVTVTHALYDIEAYRQKGVKMERQARLLSQTIRTTNGKITFEFAGAERYI